jgi:hypothetical protein
MFFIHDVVSALLLRQIRFHLSRALAQAVSRRYCILAARVKLRASSCRICCGQSGTGSGFLRVLRLPLPIIPPSASHSSSFIIQIVAYEPSEHSFTPN